MGACAGKEIPGDTPEMRQRAKEIETDIRQHNKALSKEVKMLLLGSGESGKSTIVKQMKILYLTGFDDEERKAFLELIYANILSGIKSLILGAEKLGEPFEDQNKELAITISNISYLGTAEISPQLKTDLERLWSDKGIQSVLQRSNEFQIHDSVPYFFKNLDRIVKTDFIPSDQDLLYVRAKTTGINETQFDVKDSTSKHSTRFKMVDVGGQRSERKKWIHCFQDVTALIFFVSLSEYDQKLYEDDNVNRMHESIRLFDEICNSRWFKSASIIIFFNKRDLFEEKIKIRDLKCCFLDYSGGNDYNNALTFIQQKFMSLNKTEQTLYPHVTCATDTNNVRAVFEAVRDIILQKAFSASGF